MLYKEDKEYMEHVGQLIAQPRVQKLKTITHHIYSNRLEHSIHVSYTSYKIAKKLGWDAKSTARGGLLHDMFYYDWRETKFNKRNARKVTKLNKVEEDIILKHMWGATVAPPRYKEGYIVTIVDKYWAIKEAMAPVWKRIAKRRLFHRKMLKS